MKNKLYFDNMDYKTYYPFAKRYLYVIKGIMYYLTTPQTTPQASNDVWLLDYEA